MKKILVSVILSALFCASTFAGDSPESKPLEQFSWLIGGKWKMDQRSYHTFEWGFKKGTVVAKTFSKTENGYELASQGVWFWHPEEKVIKGFFHAGNMPFQFIEFTTKFESGTMHNQLKSFGKDGKIIKYTSTWTPTKERDGYTWRLFSGSGDQKKEIMKGMFKQE